MDQLYLSAFKRHFRYWVRCACGERGCDLPGDEFYEVVRRWLGQETILWIGWGLRQGLILEEAHRFRVTGSTAGPFQWFSRRDWQGHPLHPNWEAFFHVAFFVRLWRPCQERALRVMFEHKNMDIAVFGDERLIWCIEAKVGWLKVQKLIADVGAFGGEGVDIQVEDRGNDPLRKAKYLILNRPEFFSVVEPGLQHHFEVVYKGVERFDLRPVGPPVRPLDKPPPLH